MSGRSVLRTIFRSLTQRNYRLFFIGQGTSLIGTWITRVATTWLVYRLTKSALMLGLIGFAAQLPTFTLAPITGVLVERWNRRRVIVATQALSMLLSALLAVFAFTHTITVWHVLVVGIFQGLVAAVEIPARQAFVVELVDTRGDVSN